MKPNCSIVLISDTLSVNLLRIVGLVVTKLCLLLQNLVDLGGVRGGFVAAAGGSSGHGQDGSEHKLKNGKGTGLVMCVFVTIYQLVNFPVKLHYENARFFFCFLMFSHSYQLHRCVFVLIRLSEIWCHFFAPVHLYTVPVDWFQEQ